jgi:CBS domain-containing protein
MAQIIRDVMTPDPISIHEASSVADAARAMRDADIGNVIVFKDNQWWRAVNP